MGPWRICKGCCPICMRYMFESCHRALRRAVFLNCRVFVFLTLDPSSPCVPLQQFVDKGAATQREPATSATTDKAKPPVDHAAAVSSHAPPDSSHPVAEPADVTAPAEAQVSCVEDVLKKFTCTVSHAPCLRCNLLQPLSSTRSLFLMARVLLAHRARKRNCRHQTRARPSQQG
jgi:hypothetical protein